jgi:hypothetical protein
MPGKGELEHIRNPARLLELRLTLVISCGRRSKTTLPAKGKRPGRRLVDMPSRKLR